MRKIRILEKLPFKIVLKRTTTGEGKVLLIIISLPSLALLLVYLLAIFEIGIFEIQYDSLIDLLTILAMVSTVTIIPLLICFYFLFRFDIFTIDKQTNKLTIVNDIYFTNSLFRRTRNFELDTNAPLILKIDAMANWRYYNIALVSNSLKSQKYYLIHNYIIDSPKKLEMVELIVKNLEELLETKAHS